MNKPGDFYGMLADIADGWSNRDPRKAADRFSDDAVYYNPETGHIFRGYDDIYKFFYGEGPNPRPMTMVWHHWALSDGGNTGFGEYTFSIPGEFTTHGIAVLELRENKVKSWREYQHRSNKRFEDWAGPSLVNR